MGLGTAAVCACRAGTSLSETAFAHMDFHGELPGHDSHGEYVSSLPHATAFTFLRMREPDFLLPRNYRLAFGSAQFSRKLPRVLGVIVQLTVASAVEVVLCVVLLFKVPPSLLFSSRHYPLTPATRDNTLSFRQP